MLNNHIKLLCLKCTNPDCDFETPIKLIFRGASSILPGAELYVKDGSCLCRKGKYDYKTYLLLPIQEGKRYEIEGHIIRKIKNKHGDRRVREVVFDTRIPADLVRDTNNHTGILDLLGLIRNENEKVN
jgi:hypothetical protein